DRLRVRGLSAPRRDRADHPLPRGVQRAEARRVAERSLRRVRRAARRAVAGAPALRRRRMRRKFRAATRRRPKAGGTAAVVVSGFLGSGKTTLVRHLLADARRTGSRVAVVSNEFGELGIDAALLSDVSDDYVELSGGCVCCKLSDALVETLEVLRRRAHPDRIVIETSGVALPFETQLQLWRDPVRQWISDDVAVVVVNAEQLAAGRDLDDTFTQQVSSADFLLLNQTDRVPAAALPSLERELRKWEPEAPLLPTVHAQVSPEVLFPPDLAEVRAQRRAAGGVGSASHRHAHFAAEE